ncbi:hypothetical protein NKI56_23985 [Mesorhizobium sp. M0622]|uniref:hypothetical protein n=1 Tax=unclassified Mesorhizobium TaxID=325217 RepID=UPI00333AA7E1
MTAMGAAALLILVLTYAGIAIGRIHGLRLDRAGIAPLDGPLLRIELRYFGPKRIASPASLPPL